MAILGERSSRSSLKEQVEDLLTFEGQMPLRIIDAWNKNPTSKNVSFSEFIPTRIDNVEAYAKKYGQDLGSLKKLVQLEQKLVRMTVGEKEILIFRSVMDKLLELFHAHS